MIYIFDIDGTIADATHRLHFIQDHVPRKWDEFFAGTIDDAPKFAVIDVLSALYAVGHDIWYWSARPEHTRKMTLTWLNTFGLYPCMDDLRMRPDGDRRHDDILKEEWLHSLSVEERSRLAGVFEDRARVAEMYRRNGVTCFHVARGNF